jgi:hypothetical protein
VNDLLSVLTVFAGVRYPARDVSRLAGRRVMLESSAWESVGAAFERRGVAKGLARGMSKGKRLGELDGGRKLCLQLIKAFQPRLLARARPVVRSCDDAALLERWSVKAPRLDGRAFARLLGLDDTPAQTTSVSIRRRLALPAHHSRR